MKNNHWKIFFLNCIIENVWNQRFFFERKEDDGTVAIQRKKMPDKGQREACGCMVSKDIGQYNTCPHQCEYCYANASKELATENWKRHQLDPHSELIVPML